MQIRLDGFDRLLSMHSCHAGNDDCLQPLLLDHLFVRGVDSDTPWLEVLFRPLDFALVWCAGCDELGAGCAVEEVQGVTLAHAAEACAGDLEFLRRHVDCEVW